MGSSSRAYDTEVRLAATLQHAHTVLHTGHHFENLTISGHARVHNEDNISYDTSIYTRLYAIYSCMKQQDICIPVKPTT